MSPRLLSRRTSGRTARFQRRQKLKRLSVQELEPRIALTTLPPGFTETLVTTNSDLSGPTAMEFSPDGRLWTLEQAGNVKLVRNDGTTFTALHKTVDSSGERGMLGIAFDPNFTANHFVYLYYTNPSAGGASWATGVHNQLSRFTVDDSNPLQPVFTNEAAILDWNNLSGATNHNGGTIHFGKDGMLYADAGDNVQTFTGPDGNTYRVSQTLANLLGKQLRIDVSKFNSGVATRDDVTVGHLIPVDNPFVGTASGINQLIYVLGLRNPFTFAVQPGTGRILINDVGETTWEEIDDSIAGANYGWSGGNTDGFGHPPPSFAPGTYHDPLMAYDHSNSPPTPSGVAITGGVFYPANSQFGAAYAGKYFFADFGANFIRVFDPANPGTLSVPDTSADFASNPTTSSPVDLKVDASGNLYYLARGGTGEIYRISYTGTYGPTAVVGRKLFYNNSHYDGNNAAVNAADDDAIAADKVAYLPGSGAATFANVSSYTKGINGIMIDISGNLGPISALDFDFRMGNNNSPGSWAKAPAPQSVVVRPGAGSGGSTRVEIVWADGAIQKKWLEVQVRGNDVAGGHDQQTGLAASDVFYWGNAVGDSGQGDSVTDATVDTTDELEARNHPASVLTKIPVTNIRDYNRDGAVDSIDCLVPRNNATTLGTVTKYLNLALSSASPEGGDAVALALTAPMSASPDVQLPRRLELVDLNNGVAAQFFRQLAELNTPRALKLALKMDEIDDALSLDDTLFDGSLAELGLA